MESLKKIMDWYQSNCNGDWEHTYGIRITTVDNPGWFVEIDILETEVEGRIIDQKSIDYDDNDDDWYFFKSDGKAFKASGDPTKLEFLIDRFNEFVMDKSG